MVVSTPSSNITLLSSFNQPDLLKQPGSRPADVLQGLMQPTLQDSDEAFVPTLTNNLFGSPRFPVGFDLYALNIMVGITRSHVTNFKNSNNNIIWKLVCGHERSWLVVP